MKIAASWSWDASTPVPMASFALTDFTSQMLISYSSNSTKNLPNQAQITITAPKNKFSMDMVMCTSLATRAYVDGLGTPLLKSLGAHTLPSD